MSAKTTEDMHPVIGDALKASELLRKHSANNPLSEAVADYLSAVAHYWRQGWLPAAPTAQDKATVRIIRAVIERDTYPTQSPKSTVKNKQK